MELKITERTFGIELEYADLNKRNVYFPDPFTWDEEEVIHNTDATRGTVAARYGGEINTPPMLLRHKDIDVFRKIVESCKANGAVARRDCGVQVHIFIGDLTVEELKRIYYLSYHTTPILKELCQLPPYNDKQRYRPSPTCDFYKRMQKAETFVDIRSIFENSHNKGFVRHFVNVASYFVRQTVEFRLFNSSTEFSEIMDCILFAYRFVDYALKHTEEDFKAIKSVDDFVTKLKVAKHYPDLPPPLLYFWSIKKMDIGETSHKAVGISKAFMSELIKNTGSEVTCVNPRMFSTEIRMSATKKVKVYCNDELNDLLYQIVHDGLRITYDESLKELRDLCEDTAVSQVACLLLFAKIYKFFGDNETYRRKLESIKAILPTSYTKAIVAAQRVVDFLQNCEYHRGTLNDAIAEQTGDIYFNFDDYSKNRTAIGYLKAHSDYSGTFEKKRTHYLGIVENLPEDRSLFVISEFPCHNMEKIYKNGSLILYSTRKATGDITYRRSGIKFIDIVTPPDNLVIDDASKLKIVYCKGEYFRQAEEMFMKKIQTIGTATFPYFVFYDNYLLGGFGFAISRVKEYDLTLRADFATNNKVPRLAKFILLCVLSKYLKRHVSRVLKREIENCYTKAFTQKPVSMKYRGMFRKVSNERNCIVYDAILGTKGDFQDIINEYQKQLSRINK